MFGQTSKASAWFLNDQITADKIYFKYQSGYGNAGIGTTGFVDGEIIWFGVVLSKFWCWFNYSWNCSKFSHNWTERNNYGSRQYFIKSTGR